MSSLIAFGMSEQILIEKSAYHRVLGRIQKGMLNPLPDSLEINLTTVYCARVSRCSHDTALCDKVDLKRVFTLSNQVPSARQATG